MLSIKDQLLKTLAFSLAITAAEIPYVSPVAATTILARSAEDIDYTVTGTPATVDTSGGHFRSGYARYAYGTGSASTLVKQAPFSTPETVFWIHFQAFTNQNASSNNQDSLILYDASGVERLVIRGTGTGGQVKLSTKNAALTYTDLTTCVANGWPFNGSTVQIDLSVNYAVSGSFHMYVNGVDICPFTGNLTTDGQTQLDQFAYQTPSGLSELGVSELIAADGDTRSMALWTCAPASAGTNQNWTPNTVANVNPNAINDSNSVSTTSQPTVTEWNGPAIPAGLFTVLDISQSLRLEKGATGPATAKAILRPETGSTDYSSSSTFTLLTSFQNFFFDWGVNDPNTSAPWTTGAVSSHCGQQGAVSQP